MTLTEREEFIVVLLNIANTKTYQKLPLKQRVQCIRYMIAKKFPSITDDVWNQLAQKDIPQVKRNMKALFMEGWQKGDKLPELIKEDKAMLELDRTTLDNMDKLNLDELSKGIDLGSDLSPENDALRKAKEMKEEYDGKR